MTKIAVIGEVMVELSPSTNSTDDKHYALGFAGDTFNTATYLARLKQNVDYVTRLGDDKFSDDIINLLSRESIGADLITRVTDRQPGLYMIHNFDNGEREFFYWREQAPVRQLFNDPRSQAKIFTQLNNFDYIYLSGITLAIISKVAQDALFAFLSRFRAQGGKVVYDSNYRPRLWKTVKETQQVAKKIFAMSDIVLLTLEDEQLIWSFDSLADYTNFYQQFDIDEIIIKRGEQEVLAICGGIATKVAVPRVDNVIDTTAAGDSFNAGYIAGRFEGKSIKQSVEQAIKCAGTVIQHKGAIINPRAFSDALDL